MADNIFKLIKSIDKLDYENNQNKFSKEEFLAAQKGRLAELEAEVKAIGIDQIISATYGTLRGYINESPFDFIVSKMYSKIKEKEEVSSLSKAFQYLVNDLVETKGTAVLYEHLNKAINYKDPVNSTGLDQKDYITYEFYKDAWLARHPGQEEMVNTMFKYLWEHKGDHELSEIPSGIDKALLQSNLKEYAEQMIGSKPGEGKLAEEVISLLQLKGQVEPNKTSAVIDDFPGVPSNEASVPPLGTGVEGKENGEE